MNVDSNKLNHPRRFARCRSESRGDLRDESGFTLVEVIFSSFIFAVIMLGVFAALGHGYTLIEVSRDHTRVSQILQSELEDLRTLSWNDVDALPVGTEEAVDLSGGFWSSYAGRYACTRLVTLIATNHKQVQLKVSWQDSRGATRELDYITRFTREGLNDYYYRTFN